MSKIQEKLENLKITINLSLLRVENGSLSSNNLLLN